DLFEDIIQTRTAAIVHDNYAFFAVDTTLRYGVLIDETQRRVFAAFDQFELGDGVKIKQFCEIKTTLSRKLFFITTDDKLYEYFGSSEYATCRLDPAEFSSNDPSIRQKLFKVYLGFDASEDPSTVTTTYAAQ